MLRSLVLGALALVLLAAPARAQDDTTAADPAADPVVAKVNGQDIRRSDLQALHDNLPDQYRQMPLDVLYGPLLDQAVDGRLLLIEAEASDIKSDPRYAAQLAALEAQLARELYLRREVEKALTDEAVRARYDAMVAAMPAEDEVRASHILVATEEEAKAIALELAGGADFAELAKARSTDPSAAQNGGDLGFFRKGDMVPEFSDAAYAMQVGDTSGPVETPFGWHIIRVTERRKAEPPAYEDAEGGLRTEIAEETVMALLERLRGNAQIERFNLDGSPRVEPAAEEPAAGESTAE